MTFSMRGSCAMSPGTRPFSAGSVTRTICTFLTRGLGPPSWTTYGSRDSASFNTPGAPQKGQQAHPPSAAGDAYVVGGYRDDSWDPDNPGPSMPFVTLAALMFLLADVFDGHRQQDDLASVSLLTPNTAGGNDPLPLWVMHGGPAFRTACEAVCGRDEWAIVLLLPAGPVPDADDCPVPK